MHEKVIIVSDNTCDFSPELTEKYLISINPFHVVLGDMSFRDGVDIKPADLYTYCKISGKLPKPAVICIIDQFKLFMPFVDVG